MATESNLADCTYYNAHDHDDDDDDTDDHTMIMKMKSTLALSLSLSLCVTVDVCQDLSVVDSFLVLRVPVCVQQLAPPAFLRVT